MTGQVFTEESVAPARTAASLLKAACIVTAGVLSATPGFAAERPQTRAETSAYTATSRNADVIAFIRALQAQSGLLRVESIGSSADGHDIPMLVIGDPVPASPEDLRRDDRAVVYFQANIHGGEVEGKEAALMLARSLALDRSPAVLDRLVVLITPNFNPDGNEQLSTEHRPRQNGPAAGVGVRYNGRHQDLNRDGMKLESPEVQGLVENVLNRWDPLFYFDAHTHNGSYHQEPVTWVWGLNPLGDPAIFDFMANRAWPAIHATMRKQYGTPTLPHGDFLDPERPSAGWVPMGPEPRYLTNYVGLRNRLAVLDEQYPYADFETRVQGSYQLMLAFLDWLHAERDAVVRLVREADARTVQRGLAPAATAALGISYEARPLDWRIDIQGYEMEAAPGTYERVRPTDRKRTYTDVPYLAHYVATDALPLPRAYLLRLKDPAIIGKLRQHGIAVERLVEAARLPVEIFTASKLSGAGHSEQGHYPSTVEGEVTLAEREFPAGTYVVSMAQPLANVAAYLLEPRSDDGLVHWNYFDLYLAYQWIPVPMEYPVYKLYAPARLVTAAVSP